MHNIQIKGKTYIFCDEGLILFNKFNWFNTDGNDYLKRTEKGLTGFSYPSSIYFHRELMNCPEDKTVDHINGSVFDNRKENLRICSQSINSLNRGKNIGNYTSKYKGIWYNKINKNWRTRIRVNGRTIEIGSFKNEIDAAKAYNKKALQYGVHPDNLNKFDDVRQTFANV